MALFDCYGTPHLTTVVRTRETEVVKRLVKPLLLEPEQPISLSLSLSCVDFPRVGETEKERKQDQKLRPWLLSVLRFVVRDDSIDKKDRRCKQTRTRSFVYVRLE